MGLVRDLVEAGELICSGITAFEFLSVDNAEDYVPLREEHFDAAVLGREQAMIQGVYGTRSDIRFRTEYFRESFRFKRATVEKLQRV